MARQEVCPYNPGVAKANHDYISTPEAAKILGVSRQRVLQLIHQKRLKATKVASVYLIKKSDLTNIEARKPGRPLKGKKKR
ncbi:MAG: helix-turn-helix domain-containing protein [Pyrinomonadaceae bacterium]